MKDNHVSGAKKAKNITYKQGRYRLDWVDAIHFNNNGKKACTIIVLDPKHTTDTELVTCKICKSFLAHKNWKLQ